MRMALRLPNLSAAGLPGHHAGIAWGQVIVDTPPQLDHAQRLIHRQIAKASIMLAAVNQNQAFTRRRREGGKVIRANPRLRLRADATRHEISAEWTLGRPLASLHPTGRLGRELAPQAVPDQTRTLLDWEII